MYEYEKESIVKRYIDDVEKIGLWKSENILFQKYIDKNDMILDIGCGAGRTTFALYDVGYKNIIGIDLSSNLIKAAKEISKKKSIPINFIEGNALNLPFDTHTFDCVFFSYNGICTIPEYKNRCIAIKEFYRVLKEDGKLILSAYDRSLDSKYKSFWLEQNKLQKQKNFNYGDLNVRFNDSENVFVHISNNKEIEDMISQTNFILIYKEEKSKIARPKKCEIGVYGQTYFYIYIKKEECL